jgi:hypothetical protein
VDRHRFDSLRGDQRQQQHDGYNDAIQDRAGQAGNANTEAYGWRRSKCRAHAKKPRALGRGMCMPFPELSVVPPRQEVYLDS